MAPNGSNKEVPVRCQLQGSFDSFRRRRLGDALLTRTDSNPSQETWTKDTVDITRRGDDYFRGSMPWKISVMETLFTTLDQIADLRKNLTDLTKAPCSYVLMAVAVTTAAEPQRSFRVYWERVEGTLSEVLDRTSPDMQTVHNHIQQVLFGIDFLHSQNIVHGHIRGKNIYLQNSDQHKFGLLKLGETRAISEVIEKRDHVPSYMYFQNADYYPFAAPEFVDDILNERDPRSCSDIWSFGCTVIEMLSRGRPPRLIKRYQYAIEREEFAPQQPDLKLPVLYTFLHNFYQSKSNPQKAALIQLGPDIPDTYQGEKLIRAAKRFVENCLEHDLTKRLTASNLVSNEFIKLDFSELARRDSDQTKKELPSSEIRFEYEKLLTVEEGGMQLYKAIRKDVPGHITVKAIPLPLDKPRQQDQIKVLTKVFDAVQKLDHKNLVKHLGMKVKPITSPVDMPEFLIFTEYCLGGTLSDAVIKRDPGSRSAAQEKSWMQEILNALVYLHDQRIVHRDIRTANIFFTGPEPFTGSLKIGGFVYTRRLEGQATRFGELSHSRGHCRYTSPEMIQAYTQNVNIGRKTDVWSYGCVVLEIATGEPPRFFKDGGKTELMKDMEIMKHVASGILPSIPPNLTPELTCLLKRCFHTHPDGRPTAAELRGDPFFCDDHDPQSSASGKLQLASV